MSVPSLSVSVHDRYSAQIRDKIAHKLREPLVAGAYVMLTPAHLAALAKIESADEPVISLCLHLSPDRRVSGAWRTAIASLAGAALQNCRSREFLTTRLRSARLDDFRDAKP
jgi:hypothetical protein